MDRFKALIVLFVVFIAASSSAQPHETGALFSIGPTFAGGDGADNLSGVLAVNGGGFVGFDINETIHITMSVTYTGRIYSYDDDPISYEYITIPVDFEYRFPESPFYAFLGPELGFLLSAELDGEDISNYTPGTQFGFNIGVGAKIHKSIALDARYYKGFSSVNDHVDIYHSSLLFGLRYFY